MSGNDFITRQHGRLSVCLAVAANGGVEARAFRHLHKMSASVAAQTFHEHAVGIDAWHAAMSLILTTAYRDRKLEGSEAIRGSRYLRLSFAVGSLLTGKTALEACLSGQYVQSLMMCRFLVESWIRVAYLELQPDAAQSWFSHPGRGPEPVNNGPMLRRLRRSEHHRINANVAENLIGVTDRFAHPSPHTVANEFDHYRRQGRIGPTYRPELAVMCIDIGATSTLLVASELPSIVQAGQGYAEDLGRIESLLTVWEATRDGS